MNVLDAARRCAPCAYMTRPDHRWKTATQGSEAATSPMGPMSDSPVLTDGVKLLLRRKRLAGASDRCTDLSCLEAGLILHFSGGNNGLVHRTPVLLRGCAPLGDTAFSVAAVGGVGAAFELDSRTASGIQRFKSADL